VPDRPASATLRVRLERLLASAGLEVPFETVLIWGVSATAGVALFALTMTRSLWGALGALVVLALSVQMYLDRRVTKQTEKFERQLIAAMDLAARSLRAGHPLLSSFRLISDEIAAPVGTIFARVCQQQAMGMSLEQALRQVAEESGSPDLKVFATSVVIQMRSGANLADMMERLTMVIRDRMRLAAHIRVLTAQTRFSKRVLLAVPIGLFVLVNFINPEYMRPLYESDLGKVLLGIGVGGMLLGAWLMRHMAKLRY
jgi:tight adherence protein B